MVMKYIVYITINQCNGKFYIGVHRTNPDVFDGYIGCGVTSKATATDDYPFHKAVRKYGYENFKRTTLVEFPDTEEGKAQAYALEAILINERSLKSKNLYNACRGGISRTGDPSQLKRVYKFSLTGNYLGSYKSLLAAGESICKENPSGASKNISCCCNGKHTHAYGYYWSFTKKFSYEAALGHKLPVAQYTKSGKFIRYYDSITEAEATLKLTSIAQSVKKEYLCGGFQWRAYTGDTSNINAYKKYDIEYKTIVKISSTGESVEYKNIDECIQCNPELSSTQIHRVLKGKIKTTKGYKFHYKD